MNCPEANCPTGVVYENCPGGNCPRESSSHESFHTPWEGGRGVIYGVGAIQGGGGESHPVMNLFIPVRPEGVGTATHLPCLQSQ